MLGLYDLIHPHPALLTSCNERAPVQGDCGPVAMILGRVATIMGRTVLASCNQCGPAGAMIAVPSVDVCSPLQVAACCAGTSVEPVAGAESIQRLLQTEQGIKRTGKQCHCLTPSLW